MHNAAALHAELPIQDWVRVLTTVPANEFSKDHVQRHIFERTIERSSLEPYVFFSPSHYTRNLVFKNNAFECLVICWDIGQSSAIHDHNDKSAWIYLVEGRLLSKTTSSKRAIPLTGPVASLPPMLSS